MAVELSEEARKQALASLKRFLVQNLDSEASDLQAVALLNFFLKELGPLAYNAGVTDAQTYMRDRVADLDGACFEAEFPYWPKPSVRRK